VSTGAANGAATKHASMASRGSYDVIADRILLLTLLLMTSSTLSHGFDNASTPLLDLYVLEELPANSVVKSIELDQELTSTELSGLRYSMLSRPTAPDGSVPTRPLFTIDERGGMIRTAQRLDRDTLCRRSLDESCYIRFDVAVRPMTHFRIVRVRVKIVDVNDNAPVFPRPAVSLNLPESAAIGTSLHIPAAFDADSGVNGLVRYVIMTSSDADNPFQLVERSRSDVRLVLTSPLDRETTDRYQLTIVAEDGGEPPQSGSIQVCICSIYRCAKLNGATPYI